MRLQHWFYTIRLRLRSVFRRRQVEQELDEEFQFHLSQRIATGLCGVDAPDQGLIKLRRLSSLLLPHCRCQGFNPSAICKRML